MFLKKGVKSKIAETIKNLKILGFKLRLFVIFNLKEIEFKGGVSAIKSKAE